MDYQKLHRLEAQELRSLSFFEASRILQITESSDHQVYLRDFYPEEVRDISDLDNFFLDIERKDAGLELILATEHNYELYLFAAETEGATATTLEKQFEARGLQLGSL